MVNEDVLAQYVLSSKSEDCRTRRKAVESLEVVGVAALPHLVRALEDTYYIVRWWALLALARLGGSASSALPAVHAMLGDDYASVRQAAVLVLSNIALADPSAVIKPLCEALVDDEPVIQRDALKALKRIGRRLKARPKSTCRQA